MEYTDFKTGKPITRGQYIEIGLSRGELVLKEECGCTVIQDRTADAYIVYCDKHVAAPNLYEALLEARAYISARMPSTLGKDDHLKAIDLALAKAEGKKGE